MVQTRSMTRLENQLKSKHSKPKANKTIFYFILNIINNILALFFK